MSSSHTPYDNDEDDEPVMLDADEAAEEITSEGDAAMDSGDSGDEGDEGEDQIMEEFQLQNDSLAHFDLFTDSIFCIAQHPIVQNLVAVGGSEGEDLGGIGYLFDSTPADTPVLPASYQADPSERAERRGLPALSTLTGHTDSINALAFTLPAGAALLSGGLDGKLQAWIPSNASSPLGAWKLLASAREVDEINWLAVCPHPTHPNTIALGASDGSVWVYTIDPSSADDALQIVQSYFIHTSSCTAGAWSADGKLLATVSDEGSLYVWDPFGEAAAAGVTATGSSSQAIVALTATDQRFAVAGGLFSVAIAPSGAFVVCGGAGGAIKVVGLPKLAAGAGAKAARGKAAKGGAAGSSQAGVILADLNAQSDGVETLAFAAPPSTLFAAGSVDGSIALFDSAYRFATRRMIKEAHEEFSVVKVEFERADARMLVSVGMDGVLRRWNTQGGTAVANSGFVGEWRGHRGEGEGGGILGFVMSDRGRVVTAGDDGVALVFEVDR